MHRGWAFVALLGLALPGSAQELTQRMDQVVQSFVDAQQFMGAVLVARGDTVIFSKAYGSANLEWDVPNTTNTTFRLGSITKQFTAASIALAEAQGGRWIAKDAAIALVMRAMLTQEHASKTTWSPDALSPEKISVTSASFL